MRVTAALQLASIAPLALFATACSGGGGAAAAVEGIAAPSTLSVVTTSTSGSGASAAPGGSAAPASLGFPAGSDYESDVVNVYVWDESMESLDTVNMILCFMGMTAADQMVNQGAYIAQIDEALCDAGAAEDASDGQSSAQGASAPNLWTVQSSRTSNSNAHEVDIWVPQDDLGFPALIHGHTELTERVSATDPFGQFVLDFGLVPDGGTIADPYFFGTLRTTDTSGGSAGFEFFEEQGDVTLVPPVGEGARTAQANVTMSADQSSGSARIFQQDRFNDPFFGDSGILGGEFLIDFDEDNVLTTVDGDDTCYSRTTFRQNVWRYNLYDSETGERVELNSGFGFKTSTGEYGWIGYWGIWLPEGVAATDGMVLTEDVWGEEQPAQYTVKLAPGKLIRRTQSTLALTQIGPTEFFYGEFDLVELEFVEYLVEFTAGAFHKIAALDFESGDYELLPEPVMIDTETLGYLPMYSPSLGGDVLFVHGDTFITFWSEAFVNGADDLLDGVDQIDLYGYFEMVASDITAEDWDQGGVYLPVTEVLEEPHHFVFQRSDLTLYHDTDGTGTNLVPVGLADGEEPEGGFFFWGVRSGPMVLDTSGFTEVHDIWGEAVTYTYETGPNPWNQYSVVVDTGGVEVEFDAPIQFAYTHSQGTDLNDDASFDGQTYFLEYYRTGDLGGIPQLEQDWDEDGLPDHWVPTFSIADGTLMGPTGTEYVIKAIEIEQNLLETPGDCGALSTVGLDSLPLPDNSIWNQPDIGAQPSVTDAPAVIDGTVQ